MTSEQLGVLIAHAAQMNLSLQKIAVSFGSLARVISNPKRNKRKLVAAIKRLKGKKTKEEKESQSEDGDETQEEDEEKSSDDDEESNGEENEDDDEVPAETNKKYTARKPASLDQELKSKIAKKTNKKC